MGSPSTHAPPHPLEARFPDRPQPMVGHAGLLSIFGAGVSTVALAFRRSGRALPERVPRSDLVLMSIATYKISRLISKDKITGFMRAPFTRYKGESERPSEVEEEPRGDGFRRAVGELLVCPYCLAQWVATGLVSLYLFSPRLGRLTSSLFSIVVGSDLLQQAWIAVDKRA